MVMGGLVVVCLTRLECGVGPVVPLESQGFVILTGRLGPGLVLLTSPVLESPVLVLVLGLWQTLKYFNISLDFFLHPGY